VVRTCRHEHTLKGVLSNKSLWVDKPQNSCKFSTKSNYDNVEKIA